MMNFKKTYRFISAILCMSFFSALIMPVFASFGMIEHCSTMMETTADSEHNHHLMMMEMDMISDEDCCMNTDSMDHHQTTSTPMNVDACDMFIDCNCDLSADGIETKAFFVQKTQIPQLSSDFTTLNFSNNSFDRIPPPLWYSNSYSPPLLFLSNNSFLI